MLVHSSFSLFLSFVSFPLLTKEETLSYVYPIYPVNVKVALLKYTLHILFITLTRASSSVRESESKTEKQA